MALFTTSLLHALQWTIILALYFVGGIAWCLILWVVPIIKLNTSKSAFVQFDDTTQRGHRFLKPLNRALAGLLALTAVLVSRQSDAAEAATWWYYAAALITMLQVTWWEVLTLFPINDAVNAMADQKENYRDAELTWLGAAGHTKLLKRMDSWSSRQLVRATLPLVAAAIASYPKIFMSL